MRRNGWNALSLLVVGWATCLPMTHAQDAVVEAAPPRSKVAPDAKAVPPQNVVAPDAKAAVAVQQMDDLLIKWEKQSAKLKSLDVKFKRVDHSPAWGDNELYEGRAMLQSPNLAWLDFKKVGVDEHNKPKLVPHERIVCTGKEVWQFNSPTRQIFIFPLERGQQQRALEEGPLPFLFNMKAGEAKKRYRMSLVAENASAYVVTVVPLLDIDKESFSKAIIQLDRAYLLPTNIVLFAPDEKSTQNYKFTDIKPNAVIPAANFHWTDLGPSWKVVRNPGGEGQVQNPRRPAVENAAAGEPARPRVPPGRARRLR